MILDHFFMSMIAMLFFLPGFITGLSEALNVTHEETNFNFLEGPYKFIGLFGFALYFCKDIFNGRSLSKRILKLQVVDNETDQVATPLQCFVRNIFCMFWPIEAIVALTNTKRRIGDRVAGTKLVQYDPAHEQPRLNIGKLALPLLISYGLIILLLQFMPPIPSTSQTKTNYSKTSFNASESKTLEQFLTDSLGQYFTPDIRIYDTVKTENLKYVSIILNLNENYLEDNDTYNQLNDITTNLIYSRMPKETFTGQIKYVYQGSGHYQSSSSTIGIKIKPELE